MQQRHHLLTISKGGAGRGGSFSSVVVLTTSLRVTLHWLSRVMAEKVIVTAFL